MTPRIPELWKTAQQDHEILAATAFGVVELDSVGFGVAMPYRRLRRAVLDV